MAEKRNRVGVQVAAAGGGTRTGPTKITLREAIVGIELVLTGVLTVPSGGATIKEDSILRLLRRVEVTLGGIPRKVIGDNSQYSAGGRLLRRTAQALFGRIATYTPPAATEGSNAFVAVLPIAFRLPSHAFPNLKPAQAEITSYLPGLTGEDLEVYIDWGIATDVSDTASVALASAQVEIIAVSDTDLTLRALSVVAKGGVPFKHFFDEATQAIQLALAASSAEEQDLNRLGYEPFALLQVIDDGLANDAVINRLTFNANVGDKILDGSWDFFRSELGRKANLQANPDAGWGLADYDGAGDFSGALPLTDPALIGSWRASVDHDALDAAPASRFTAHHLAMKAL